MKISIITATFNSGATLRDTMESVLCQTYEDIDYLIIDGGSNDDTLNIIRSYEPKFQGKLHYISEPDKGIYDAMNKGIQMVTGDVVGILNSDDLFIDEKVVEDLVIAFDMNTDAIHGNLYFVQQHDVNRIIRTWKGSPYKSFKYGWCPAHPTFYVRRQIYEQHGVFDLSFDVSADFELMLRLIEKTHIRTKYLDRYMIKMRMGGESTGSIINILKGNKNIYNAFRKHGISIPIFYPVYRLLPKAFNLIKCKLGLNNLDCNKKKIVFYGKR